MRHRPGLTDTFLLFVYGTLKRGGVRHAPLAGQRCLGEVVSLAEYALYHLGEYPGLTLHVEGQAVHGELYEVEGRLLPVLDDLEGAPGWFDLAPINIRYRADPVWAYFYQLDPADSPRIPGGRWDTVRSSDAVS